MVKNILIIQGGGRRGGNTEQLISAFSKGAAEAGHNVETVSLLQKQVLGCTGCNACLGGRPCVQRDDFNSLVPMIEKADLLALASPLYFWTISARTKAFLERFYSLAQHDPDPPLGRYEKYPEKDCALLMTSADDLFWTFEQAAAYYRFNVVNYLGFHDKGMILAGGCGGSRSRPNIDKTPHLDRAYEFGKNLYK